LEECKAYFNQNIGGSTYRELERVALEIEIDLLTKELYGMRV
ncbi:8927_t:CDS:1, partial [Racocetra persica]